MISYEELEAQFNLLKLVSYTYCTSVIAYLELEEMIKKCHTEEEYRNMARLANLYLEHDAMEKYTKEELEKMIKQEFYMTLKEASRDFLAKFHIEIEKGEDEYFPSPE